MLDAFTIKEWLLVYFVALAALNIGSMWLVLSCYIRLRDEAQRHHEDMRVLGHESEMVHYIKAINPQ